MEDFDWAMDMVIDCNMMTRCVQSMVCTEESGYLFVNAVACGSFVWERGWVGIR